ncbi:hypothetical protein GCM10009733_020390 [Nonomuraea maheshkhaliensis]|uniref:Uncharacterized protein n=1 Tax=Nonomuraea maheshkhaliensis TaxID=419590 RepID=A0ABP4QUR4_9ACTN
MPTSGTSWTIGHAARRALPRDGFSRTPGGLGHVLVRRVAFGRDNGLADQIALLRLHRLGTAVMLTDRDLLDVLLVRTAESRKVNCRCSCCGDGIGRQVRQLPRELVLRLRQADQTLLPQARR